MKNFNEFVEYIHGDGKTVHDEIVAEVNQLVEKAKIENPIEEQVFYYRTFSEISTLKMLEKYHQWINTEKKG